MKIIMFSQESERLVSGLQRKDTNVDKGVRYIRQPGR